MKHYGTQFKKYNDDMVIKVFKKDHVITLYFKRAHVNWWKLDKATYELADSYVEWDIDLSYDKRGCAHVEGTPVYEIVYMAYTADKYDECIIPKGYDIDHIVPVAVQMLEFGEELFNPDIYQQITAKLNRSKSWTVNQLYKYTGDIYDIHKLNNVRELIKNYAAALKDGKDHVRCAFLLISALNELEKLGEISKFSNGIL